MRRRWWILVAVSLATFMTYLDNNVTNVAIPTIQRDLHLSIAGLEWVVSSYILVFASLLLFGGRMADLFGRRRLFMIGLSVFTLSSLAAGLAGTAPSSSAPGSCRASAPPCWSRRRWRSSWRPLTTSGSARPRSASGRRSARWRWLSARYRRLHQPARALGLDLLHQRADRRDHAGDRDPGHAGVPRHQLRAQARPARPVSSARPCSPSPTRLIEGHDKGWTSALIMGAFGVAALAAAAFVWIESRARTRWWR